ncbi:histidinol-phosphatase [Microbaculum sp. FT89]|uniref:histidinol-phosphatase n=1 Tax=Microbaculum sp. FT89 TaxID=3447298 RepID=UPI003F5318D3
MTRDEFETFAHRLADAAAAATLPHFRSALAVENKIGADDGSAEAFDPVTVADRAAEQAIRDLIFEAYPDHGLHGEEFGIVPGAGVYEWVIDPIDGTRSFVSGVPLWTTIIGLRRNGVPLYGLVDQPYVGDRFWGGEGSAFTRCRDGEPRQIRTRACASLAEATMMTTAPAAISGPGERARYEKVERQVRLARYGADGYAYCLLAAGQIDLVIESGLQAYDVVGLVPIIEAAGGVFTSWSGDDAHYGGTVVAAGDPRVHAAALEALNA